MVVANHLLITGPSRGGKSEWAEQRIGELAGAAGITYLATGPTLPDDAAWQRRLNRHRQRRPDHWRLVGSLIPLSGESALDGEKRLP